MGNAKRDEEIGLKYCKDCIHIVKPAGALYEPHPESICMNPSFLTMNFVTGEYIGPLCKSINKDGKCPGFNKQS